MQISNRTIPCLFRKSSQPVLSLLPFRRGNRFRGLNIQQDREDDPDEIMIVVDRVHPIDQSYRDLTYRDKAFVILVESLFIVLQESENVSQVGFDSLGIDQQVAHQPQHNYRIPGRVFKLLLGEHIDN